MIWNLLWKVKKFDSSEQIVDNIQDLKTISYLITTIQKVECDLDNMFVNGG